MVPSLKLLNLNSTSNISGKPISDENKRHKLHIKTYSYYMLRIYAFTTVEISISWQLALRWIEVEFHSLLFS